MTDVPAINLIYKYRVGFCLIGDSLIKELEVH